MQVETVVDPGSEWDAFVEAEPGATLGHAAAWARVMRDAYGVEPHYLAARSSSGGSRSPIVGVLPLIGLRTLTGGRALVSMPYLDTGGVLTRDPEAETALLDAARELLQSRGARSLELRQTRPLAALAAGPGIDRVGLVLPLEGNEDAQWKALPAKVRNQTRKAEREGLSSTGAGDPCDGFYAPFRVNMRDLGSPVHGQTFFRACARHFGERLRFVVAWDGPRPVAGLVALHHAGRVTVPWASSLRSERRRCPNNLIYWEALRWALARGARVFDFGRSPRDSGTHRFKRGWGAEESPLHWVRLDAAGCAVAPVPASESPVLRRLASVWARLPVPLASRLGPHLRRHIAS